jgi:hypothetical protein
MPRRFASRPRIRGENFLCNELMEVIELMELDKNTTGRFFQHSP